MAMFSGGLVMKIDLSKYVGQEVEATLQNGEKIVGVMTYFPQNDSCELEYKIGTETSNNIFTVDGFYWTNRCPSDYNIYFIKIKPMRGYQQLEQQVKELQKEIERLKAQENNNKIPEDFNLDYALSFLDCPNSLDLADMFTWGISSQGEIYWEDLHSELEENSDYKVPDEAIIQIQKWVIEFYRNKGGQ
jgi:hypothetical protein